MGLFDRLTGRGMTMTVAAQPAVVAPGGELTIHYEVAGQLDDRCTELRVGVTCVAQYVVEERVRDAENRATNSEVTHEVELFADARPLAAALGAGDVAFTLPPTAAPSSTGAVHYQAWLASDHDGDSAHVERADVTVRAPAPTPGRTPDVSADGVTLRGVPDSVGAGGTLSGTVIVAPADELKARVIVRLNRRITWVGAPTGYGPELLIETAKAAGTVYLAHDLVGAAEAQIADRQTFAAGAPVELPFTLSVPADAQPSTACPYGQVDWRVEALVDQRLHDDLSVAAPIVVY